MSRSTSNELAEFEEEFTGVAAATVTAPEPTETVDPEGAAETAPPTEEAPEEQPAPVVPAESDPRRFSPMGGMPGPFTPPGSK